MAGTGADSGFKYYGKSGVLRQRSRIGAESRWCARHIRLEK